MTVAVKEKLPEVKSTGTVDGWLTWCEPLVRGDLRLANGDILDAIAWFKEQTGRDPGVICLSAKNEKFVAEVPEGIDVEFTGGVLRWEVWLGPVPMAKPHQYFDAQRDREFTEAGTHFWCQTHLSAVPISKRSPDDRYCKECYNRLLEEASLLPSNKRPKWVPRTKIGGKKAIPVPQDTVLNMHTVNGEKSEVCIIQPPVRKVTREKRRGPKHRDLPEDLIRQWDSEGIGSKAIATRLKRELDIKVHYSTIQRLLVGQRVLV